MLLLCKVAPVCPSVEGQRLPPLHKRPCLTRVFLGWDVAQVAPWAHYG